MWDRGVSLKDRSRTGRVPRRFFLLVNSNGWNTLVQYEVRMLFSFSITPRQLRMLLPIRLCRSYPVLSAGPRAPPGGRTRQSGGATDSMKIRSPAGGLHVTKEIVVISLTPFFGCVYSSSIGSSLYPNTIPCVVPRFCGVTVRYGAVARVHGLGRILRILGSVLA